jgi:hypothetical protein
MKVPLSELAQRLRHMADNGYIDRQTILEAAAALTGFDCSTLEWLKRHSDYSDDACLIWPFRARNAQGYGFATVKRQPVGAHRIMCRLAHGEPALPNMHAAHSCGVRDCVNPLHLRWATAKSNLADRAGHGTLIRGSQQHNAKLNETQVAEIARRLLAGESQKALGDEFGVCRTSVKAIARGQTWKHVTKGIFA